MDSEQSVYRDFTEGDLSYLDAVQRLKAIGLEPKDAIRLVEEWIDMIDPVAGGM